MCRFGSNNPDEVQQHLDENPNHVIPVKVRNSIQFEGVIAGNKFKLVLENVNKYNIQPGRIALTFDNTSDEIINNYKGYIVAEKWGHVTISNLNDENDLGQAPDIEESKDFGGELAWKQGWSMVVKEDN